MTRRFSRWPIAVALMIASAPAALAQAPLVPDSSMPPPPPPPSAVQQAAPAPAGVAPAGIAAIVNGEKITKPEVAKEALKAYGAQVVGQMILIKLVNQEAARQHIVVSPAQVNAKLTDLRAQYAARGGGGTLDSLLVQRHLTLASYKQQLATELRVEALVGKTLPSASGTVKYHIRHLLIATVPVGPASKPHTDAEALAIIAKAQAELKQGVSFVDVANKYTEDPSGKGNGGDLPGVYDASAPFDPVFLKAALALKQGEVTPAPVKSQFGYHLIMVESTSDAPTPADAKRFAAAAAAARTQQIQQAIPPYVQGLRSRAKIVDYLGDAPTFAPAPPQDPRLAPRFRSAPPPAP